MSNIKQKPVVEKGKEKIISWVKSKKLIVTLDTFAKIFNIPQIENPDFDFPDVEMPDLPTISQEMLLEDDTWDGEVQCNKTRLKDRCLILFLFSCHSLLPLKRTIAMSVTRASLLWAIGIGKLMDLPHIMFMGLCSSYDSFDIRVSIPFTKFLTALFKKHEISIHVDLIKTKPEKPIDKNSLN